MSELAGGEGCMFYFIFFFQAEDGIRDVAVTGVQTCALPICARAISCVGDKMIERRQEKRTKSPSHPVDPMQRVMFEHVHKEALCEVLCIVGEIGRASCRERV